MRTFTLKICNKKIANGCLYYHLGQCAGTCKEDFDRAGYLERLELAKLSLKKNQTEFLAHLTEKIKVQNRQLNFEKSKRLYGYHQVFTKVFETLKTSFARKEKSLSHKHIWIYLQNTQALFLLDESKGATKQKELFYTADPQEYFESYYNRHDCSQLIITNFTIEEQKTIELFLQKWHKKHYPVSIKTNPQSGHLKNILNLSLVHAEEALKKEHSLADALKKLLKLSIAPRTIDCFDVSHKQGQNMVGSCIRFTNGKPDKEHFRKFKIKTVAQQNDYACLKEIVSRRYKTKQAYPDIILIDGGKGQLSAVQSIAPEALCISLAKRKETVFSKNLPTGKELDITQVADQMLIALRDYAHHFAVAYHNKREENKSAWL